MIPEFWKSRVLTRADIRALALAPGHNRLGWAILRYHFPGIWVQ